MMNWRIKVENKKGLFLYWLTDNDGKIWEFVDKKEAITTANIESTQMEAVNKQYVVVPATETHCEICGKKAKVEQHGVYLTTFGKREYCQRQMCKTCTKLEEKHKL